MRDYFPTKHAVSSMAAREIPWAEVLWVLAQPEVTYVNRRTSDNGDDRKARVNQRGRLYVVTSGTPEYSRHDEAKEFQLYAVLTCGLRRTKQWNDEDARARRA